MQHRIQAIETDCQVHPRPSAHECNPLASPLDVVAADLVEHNDIWGWIPQSEEESEFDSPKLLIAVSTQMGGESFYISESQIQSELTEEQWQQASELAAALAALNGAKQPVSLAVPIAGAVLRDSDLGSMYRIAQMSNDPNLSSEGLRGQVSPWVPAVSPDGKRALVRFSIAPSPHGASGTYLLERCERGGWKVIWSNFAFYS